MKKSIFAHYNESMFFFYEVPWWCNRNKLVVSAVCRFKFFLCYSNGHGCSDVISYHVQFSGILDNAFLARGTSRSTGCWWCTCVILPFAIENKRSYQLYHRVDKEDSIIIILDTKSVPDFVLHACCFFIAGNRPLLRSNWTARGISF